MSEANENKDDLEGKFKVDIETATSEFERFCEGQGIEVYEDDLTEEDLKSYRAQKMKVIRGIMRGQISINDDAEAVVNYQKNSESTVHQVTFSEPEGKNLQSMDRCKKGEDIKAMYVVMAEITKKPATTFSSMRNRDLKLCGAITALFLGS